MHRTLCDTDLGVLHLSMCSQQPRSMRCIADDMCCAVSQVQAVFEVIPAPRADGETQQSSCRLVGFARCACLSAWMVPSPAVVCRAHAANYRLSTADLHATCWSGRAISDGVFAALVCDIMVHPDLQASDRQLMHHRHQICDPNTWPSDPRAMKRESYTIQPAEAGAGEEDDGCIAEACSAAWPQQLRRLPTPQAGEQRLMVTTKQTVIPSKEAACDTSTSYQSGHSVPRLVGTHLTPSAVMVKSNSLFLPDLCSACSSGRRVSA